jgi:hypothetical protein
VSGPPTTPHEEKHVDRWNLVDFAQQQLDAGRFLTALYVAGVLTSCTVHDDRKSARQEALVQATFPTRARRPLVLVLQPGETL